MVSTNQKLAAPNGTITMDSEHESYEFLRASLRRLLRSPAFRHALLVLLCYSLLFVTFFSPVIFRGSLLAVGGDGLFIYLPNFYSRKVLWDTLIFSGFPMLADPQVMTWYPPAFVLSLLPGTWNLFIVSAYVCASAFMYGYIHTLTKSRLAAFLGGTVYGTSGFMMAHLGHAVIIHVAAWIPLIIWSLEMLRRKITAKWLALGSLAVAMSFLAGHSQILVYGLLVALAYVIALGWSAPAGRWRYYLTSLIIVLLGFSLAAVQIIPTAELLRESIRVGYPFNYFIAHALPPRQAFTTIFPMVFGGPTGSGALPYFGVENQTELTGYVGLLPLLFAAVALFAKRIQSPTIFWLCVALFAFVLAMGNATPLARLLYHVPILNSFRAPARHFFELTFAASVLCGLGVAAIQRRQISPSLFRNVMLFGGFFMIICVVLLFMNAGYMSALAAQKDIGQLRLLPWSNRAVAVPLLIFLIGVAVLAFWYREPGSYFRQALLLSALIIDLASFGWFYEWRFVALAKDATKATEMATRYKTQLESANQRMISYTGLRETIDMPANLTRLWGVPNAAGNNVLMLSRIDKLLPMIDKLETPLPWSAAHDKSLDIMAVRYLFFPQNQVFSDANGISWIKQDARFMLGYGCNEPPRHNAKLTLPKPVRSTGLAIVSRLACSPQIPDGTEVTRLRIADAQGKTETHSLLAGRDSSEWAYDCGQITPQMKHQRANIFGNYPSEISHVPCQAHFYLTTVGFDDVKDIKSIDFEWVDGPGAIILDKLTLKDEVSKTSYPIDSGLMDAEGWRFVEETPGIRIYENLRAMPRVWLTPEVVSVNSAEALAAVKSGTLKDGREFEPARMALVEAPITLTSEADPNATATVTGYRNTLMDVRTSSRSAAFLVTSDAHFPGWRARIDGQETQLYRADYAIRGVLVPPGEHLVQFEYKPKSFYVGAAISAVGLLLISGLLFGPLFVRRRST